MFSFFFSSSRVEFAKNSLHFFYIDLISTFLMLNFNDYLRLLERFQSVCYCPLLRPCSHHQPSHTPSHNSQPCPAPLQNSPCPRPWSWGSRLQCQACPALNDRQCRKIKIDGLIDGMPMDECNGCGKTTAVLGVLWVFANAINVW